MRWEKGGSLLYLIVHIMQVQLLAKDSLNFLLDFLELHRSSEHQDPTRKRNTDRRIRRDLTRLRRKLLLSYMHMCKQNLYKLLFFFFSF